MISAAGKKKARCSFASRRFPVYNLMKSFESVINNSFRFAAVSFAVIDDTKVQQVASIVKDKKDDLLSLFYLTKSSVFY
jgi:hypothetical protein